MKKVLIGALFASFFVIASAQAATVATATYNTTPGATTVDFLAVANGGLSNGIAMTSTGAYQPGGVYDATYTGGYGYDIKNPAWTGIALQQLRVAETPGSHTGHFLKQSLRPRTPPTKPSSKTTRSRAGEARER